VLQDLILERVWAQYTLNEPDMVVSEWRVLRWERGNEQWTLCCADTETECRKFCEELGPDALVDTFRIVCGERRWRAAGIAGLAELPARVYTGLSPEQRFAMQFIENNQRENITALEAAAALAKQLDERQRLDVGFSAEMLAKELGISRAGFYERLKLNRLQPQIRAALVAGTISTSIAGEIAKLPTPKLQGKLLAEIEGRAKYRPMSVREVQAEIADEYVKALAEAPFQGDETYRTEGTAALPLCATCPSRTGNMVEEFPELRSKPQVCTNPECFGEKCKAFWKLKAAEEAQTGQTVLTEKEFKAQKSKLVAGDAYVALENNGGTFAGLMGKHAPEPVLVATAQGLERFYVKEEAMAAARKNGTKFRKEGSAAEGEKERAKREATHTLRASRETLAERAAVKLGAALNKLKPAAMIEVMAGLATKPPGYRRLQSAAWEEAKTPVAKIVINFCGEKLCEVTDWETGNWDDETLKLWKALGVDLEAEEAAAVLELPVKREPEQMEMKGTNRTKKTHGHAISAKQKMKIQAAQKARWGKIKSKVKG
jgi:ParB/RepB/Spo0J family partition protein